MIKVISSVCGKKYKNGNWMIALEIEWEIWRKMQDKIHHHTLRQTRKVLENKVFYRHPDLILNKIKSEIEKEI